MSIVQEVNGQPRPASCAPGLARRALLAACFSCCWSPLTASNAGAEPSPPAALDPAKLEVGVDLELAQRTMTHDRVELSASMSWTVHANVLLLPWLGLRTEGGMEYLQARLGEGATGVGGEALDEPMVSGPRVVGSLQPSYRLNPCWQLFARAGVGWQRFEVDSVRVGEPTPLLMSERTGVMIEFPASVGVGYAPLSDWLVFSADAGIRIAGPQSGALFDSRAGASQSLRQDTGELVHVAPFPMFGNAIFTRISLDIVF